MKTLVIGSGGREHAIARSLALSLRVEQVFVAPGNGLTMREAKVKNIRLRTHEEIITFVRENSIGLTVVGPEVPLAEGLADDMRAVGLRVIGPGKEAARLESSKVYSKDFMRRYGVRTAASRSFNDSEAALGYTRKYFQKEDAASPQPRRLVIKEDGLAAGKGVIIASSLEEAEAAIREFEGKPLVLEEFLEGREVSIMAAVDGTTILSFISARDHKARFEGGKGPNTGGMGAIAPVADFSDALWRDFEKAVMHPTLRGIQAEKLDYRGFLFFGLMVYQEKNYLLEYNVRLGDPETEALLPLMHSDFLELCLAIDEAQLSSFTLNWRDGFCCAPVAVSEGYPGSYPKGRPITLDATILNDPALTLYGAGVKAGEGDSLLTDGGRVLSVSACAATLEAAREAAYAGLSGVSFEGMGYRKDIGI
jgi:phosphoribosylamine--glycine ligase